MTFECRLWSGKAPMNARPFKGPGWFALARPREHYIPARGIDDLGRAVGPVFYSRRFRAYGQETT